jgi:hypothetical protein
MSLIRSGVATTIATGKIQLHKKGRTMGAAFRYFEAIFKGAPGVLKNRSSSGAQIVGRRFARATIGHDFVADLLAFTQRTKTGTFDSADVHEHVIAAVIRLDEAIALGCVKPLHGSHAHGGSPFSDIQVVAHLSMGW